MIQFAKLDNGDWGITSDQPLSNGQRVGVERKDGRIVPGTVGRVLSRPNSQGRVLATFISDERPAPAAPETKPAAPVEPAPKTKPYRPSPHVLVGDATKGRWRPCGYPGCSRAHCDECDGFGR